MADKTPPHKSMAEAPEEVLAEADTDQDPGGSSGLTQETPAASGEAPSGSVQEEDGEWVSEAELAGGWGVSRDRLRELREELEEGVDWRRDFRVIEYSRGGSERVRGLLEERLQAAGAAGAGPASLPPKPPSRRREPAVVLRLWRNERLMQAEIEGRSCRVRVRTNENFVPGMRFEAVHEHDDVWRYEGRLPRRKGVW